MIAEAPIAPTRYRGSMPSSPAGVEIRPMLARDVEAAAQVILDGGWSDRSGFFMWAVDHPTCFPIVADEGGRVVGTGLATANGRVGWVGAIFVAQDRRRIGLGSALSAEVIDELERQGCSTQVLIATDEGRPIYERLGFRLQTRYVLLQAPDGAAPPDQGVVRPYDPEDFAAIARLDRAATGEDRSTILRSFADPTSCRVAARADGSIGGFAVRAPWGGRALVATEPDLALALLDDRRRAAPDHRVTIGVLEANSDGRARLADAGWNERPGGPRLLRGEPLIWRPDWIYGQFTGALG
jgi:GNAT superfamily N-acetyltransferase